MRVGTFDLVTCCVAAHHFTVRRCAHFRNGLRPGKRDGYLLPIDGSRG